MKLSELKRIVIEAERYFATVEELPDDPDVFIYSVFGDWFEPTQIAYLPQRGYAEFD